MERALPGWHPGDPGRGRGTVCRGGTCRELSGRRRARSQPHWRERESFGVGGRVLKAAPTVVVKHSKQRGRAGATELLPERRRRHPLV